jgi:hypothetical protein
MHAHSGDCVCSRRYRTRGQRHVRRDHDVAATDPVRNPVVCGIKAATDQDTLDQGVERYMQKAVATTKTLIPCRPATR